MLSKKCKKMTWTLGKVTAKRLRAALAKYKTTAGVARAWGCDRSAISYHQRRLEVGSFAKSGGQRLAQLEGLKKQDFARLMKKLGTRTLIAKKLKCHPSVVSRRMAALGLGGFVKTSKPAKLYKLIVKVVRKSTPARKRSDGIRLASAA